MLNKSKQWDDILWQELQTATNNMNTAAVIQFRRKSSFTLEVLQTIEIFRTENARMHFVKVHFENELWFSLWEEFWYALTLHCIDCIALCSLGALWPSKLWWDAPLCVLFGASKWFPFQGAIWGTYCDANWGDFWVALSGTLWWGMIYGTQ